MELFKKLFIEKKIMSTGTIDETVLANEQVIDGKGYDQVLSWNEKLSQWFFIYQNFQKNC